MSQMYKCLNEDCIVTQIEVSKEQSSFKCPCCHEEMVLVNNADWLSNLANNNDLWVRHAFDIYPSIISYEYKRLRDLCYEKKAYGALLCLKDNFELLLKYETLLVYAWAVHHTEDRFINEVVAQITVSNPSFGTWLELARHIIKHLKQRDVAIADMFPLGDIISFYNTNTIVNWRNEKIGHGVLGFEEDEDFQADVKKKIELLKKLFIKIDNHLINQKLVVKKDDFSFEFIGVENARNIDFNGELFAEVNDYGTDEISKGIFSAEPFFVIKNSVGKGYSTYIFDNQKKASATCFQSYIDGKHETLREPFFEQLRANYEKKGIQLDVNTRDNFTSVSASRELDVIHASNDFFLPEHLLDWIRECVDNNEKGVFLLKMPRGMGKSTFTEKINRLYKSPLIINEDLDVRTYHMGRVQTSGIGDMFSYIEWQWSHDYLNREILVRKRITDFLSDGEPNEAAMAHFLSEIRNASDCLRNCGRILLVIDGIDEALDDEVLSFIPCTSLLSNGVYILLTERCDATIKSRSTTRYEIVAEKNISYESEENEAFLQAYYDNVFTKAPDMSTPFAALYEKSDHRILYFSTLCTLIKEGMTAEELADSSNVVNKYLNIIGSKYGKKEFSSVIEILSIITVLGRWEPLTLREIGDLSSGSGVTYKLIGIMSDLSPLLTTIRTEQGNAYQIVNKDIATNIEDLIPDVIQNQTTYMVQLAIDVLRKQERVDAESGEMVVISHLIELSKEIPGMILEEIEPTIAMLLDDCVEKFRIKKSPIYDKKRALDLLNQLYLLYGQLNGETDRTTQSILYDIADWQKELGDYIDAQNTIRRVYETLLANYGETDEATISSQEFFAETLKDFGQYKAALELYSDAYEKRVELSGKMNPKTVNSLVELATCLSVCSEYKKAEVAFEEALSLCDPVFPDNCREKSHLLNNYGIHLISVHQFEKALDVLENAYRIELQILDSNDREDNTTLNNIALVQGNMGKHEEALETLNQALKNESSYCDMEHPSIITIQSNIALQLGALGKNIEALELFQELYERLCKISGFDSPNTLMVQYNIAWSHFQLGHYDKALKEYDEVYKKRCRLLGPLHVDTLMSKDGLGHALAESNQLDKAIPLFGELVRENKSTFGELDDVTLNAQLYYISILLKNRKYSDALKQLLDFREKNISKYGSESNEVREIENAISEARRRVKPRR